MLQLDAQTLSFMLTSLTPAQFKVWVASQVTDGSSAEVAKLLGLGVRQIQKHMKAIPGTANAMVVSEAGTANAMVVSEAGTANAMVVPAPNAIGTRTRTRTTPSSVRCVKDESLSEAEKAKKAEATARLEAWAKEQGYQPLSEMPIMSQRLWGLLDEQFGRAGPQVLGEILDYLASPAHKKKDLACYLAYIIAIVKKWAADPAAREATKSATWAARRLAQAAPPAQPGGRGATQPPKQEARYAETKFGRFRR